MEIWMSVVAACFGVVLAIHALWLLKAMYWLPMLVLDDLHFVWPAVGTGVMLSYVRRERARARLLRRQAYRLLTVALAIGTLPNVFWFV